MIEINTFTNQVTMPASILNLRSTFPTLRILPINKLVPHELCDTARSYALQERLLSDGVLRNPPIVAPLQDVDGNYMVLDGANRTNALKMMGIPHILVQVASLGRSGFNLTAWNQVVLGISPEKLLSILGSIAEINLKKDQRPGYRPEGIGSPILIQVRLPSGDIYNVFSQSSDLPMRVQYLNSILARIGQYARLDRTHMDDLDALTGLNPDLAGLIIFPCFKFEEIVQLATAGQFIPAGITHFSISPRALRVNYKISDLLSNKSLFEKNEMLMAMIQARVTLKGVRFYNETTVMFDE